LCRTWKMLLGNAPNPFRSVRRNANPLGQPQAASNRLSVYPVTKHLGGFDCTVIASRPLVPKGLSLFVYRRLGENASQLRLPRLCLSGLVLALAEEWEEPYPSWKYSDLVRAAAVNRHVENGN
jgi:hypothetical protein